MDRRVDIIIVGSGIGGLAMGALLLHKQPNRKILILEKNSGIGGRLFSYEKEGFKLDIGAHVFSRSDKGPVGDILRMMGKEERIRFTYVRPMTSYRGNIFAFPKGLHGMISEKDFDRLTSMFKEITSLTFSQMEELDSIDLCSYVHRFTDNGLVHACIDNVCNVYVCVPYFKASAGEFIRCIQAEARARASGYPQDGCKSVADAIAEGITDNGGVIETNAQVDKIIIEDYMAKGVIANGKNYFADIIISNADIKHTMLNLVGEDQLSKKYAKSIKALEYSYSMLVLRIALDKILADWRLLTHIGCDNPIQYHRDLEAGKIPSDLLLFMPVPSNFAPDVAPEGKQLLVASTFVPFNFKDIEGLKEAIIDTVQYFLIPDIRKHIMWIDVSTPSTICKFAGEEGAIVGLGQTIHQTGKNRPGNRTPIKNLYLCGAEAGGWGVGTELAVESAKALSQLIS